jgi:tetratricopeptide (TPR) repeat protein
VTRRTPRKIDPVETAIELALQPGRFIPYAASSSFVDGLEEIETRIGRLVGAFPAPAVALYETFIAGCYEKAEEIDDSGGNFGMFVESLFQGWVRARQAAGADPDETARRLIAWMEDDPYGFCHEMERDLAKALDRTGLAAFRHRVHERFEHLAAAIEQQRSSGLDSAFRRWAELLRTVLATQRDGEAYVELCDQTELTPEDCLALAKMLQARRKCADALMWVERGLELHARRPSSLGGYELTTTKRELLKKLGRGDDALQSAWAGFEKDPGKFTYDELMRFVPKTDRATWHAKAMELAASADLESVLELWLKAKEIDRLVARLRIAGDAEIEGVSHYTTEPVAARLARTHPDMAANVFRALGMRILESKKSKYYGAALSNFERAESCYRKAGLAAKWLELVEVVRSNHHRKVGFMTSFEELVAGSGPGSKPSFLDRAKTRWSKQPLE